MNKSYPYLIQLGDTLASIWEKYPFVSTWQKIVEYNQLDYPYIADTSYPREAKASGQVQFGRKHPAVEDLVIAAGTMLLAGRILFVTLEAGLLSNEAVYSNPVFVEAVAAGTEYNVPAYSITGIADSLLESQLTVFNSSPITGGFKRHIKYYGETLYIPYEDDQIVPDKLPDYDTLYGKDIFAYDNLTRQYGELLLTESGDFTDVHGTDNLAQALVRRLTTPEGTLPKHPHYGSRFHKRIGTAINYNLPDLLNYEVIRCLKGDPRVKAVANVSISIHNDAAIIECTVVTQTDETFPLNFILQ